MISLQNVAFSYGRQPFMENISCTMHDGRMTALLGPNGSGKSTLLRLCARLLKPTDGKITVNGADISSYGARAFAREAAFLPQSRPTPSLSVYSLVLNGRFPYLGVTGRPSADDRRAAEEALELTGMTAFMHRPLATLSGGERQKAYIAMLVAQGAQNLLLDEPTTFLDIAHRIDLMRLLTELKARGKCIVMVLHDIDLAPEYCTDALVMSHGKLIHCGAAADIAESGAVERAYGVRAIPNAGMRFERLPTDGRNDIHK